MKINNFVTFPLDMAKVHSVLVRAGEGAPVAKVQTVHEVADLTAEEIEEIMSEYDFVFPEAAINKENVQMINWTEEDEEKWEM